MYHLMEEISYIEVPVPGKYQYRHEGFERILIVILFIILIVFLQSMESCFMYITSKIGNFSTSRTFWVIFN